MIDTDSVFYYGQVVTAEPYNGYLDINEGGGDLQVGLDAASYTLTSLAIALRNALNTQATLEYTVSVDRASRKFTISATANFSLLLSTGASVGSSIWTLLGFTQGVDLTGAMTYTGESPSGSRYDPQFKLQSYVDPEDFQESNQAQKNVAADGKTVEVIRFGIATFYEMDIKFITSRDDISDGVNIRGNPTGLQDARTFMQYITQLNPVEFIPDKLTSGEFSEVILETAPGFTDGTGYKLKELFSNNLRDVYETGVLKFRVIR